MEMFENSFWQSGYPIGIAILFVWFVVSKINKRGM